MTWTILDTASAILLVMAFTSTWCVVRGQLIANRRKKESDRCN
jgi:5-enolpyruvylshikimate-3-phosphate synthase